MKKSLFRIAVSGLAVFAGLTVNLAAQPLTGYVQSFVGSSNFGTTNPGAVCPAGMMSVSPFNVTGSQLNTFDKDARWWSTPYSSDNCYFTGYSHVNLSGVGCPELGTVVVMPTSGPLVVDNRQYGSEYTEEKAEPGYYSNRLTAYDILTEVTATPRSSIERYTFHEGPANILVNLGQGLTNESGAWVRRISETEIEGMRLCGSFCYNPKAVFPQYFYIRVVRHEVRSGFWKKQPAMTAEAAWDEYSGKYKIYENAPRELAGDDIGAWFSFDAAEGESVLVQVGVSFVSAANARLNLEKEQPSADFDVVRGAAHEAWENDLGRIRVSGGTERQKQIFYTSLYHALIHPNILNDVNGEYPLMQGGPLAKSNG
ncbi:MAG: GH92 family glycosyl hydrolase, partial [Bacteroidales bacterium]|nr:GH92 family glycosyl hydrolase [Bacteroidales bacterium]